jgi:hypothetical protein
MARKSWALTLLGLAVIVLALGGGCRCSRTPQPTSAAGPPPSVRLYLVSTLAGALEPCGCVKDMLGGVDHFAALVGHDAASPHLLLGAGPLLFRDPELDAKMRAQDLLKARAIADVMSGLKLAGWAPGANDWAGGPDFLAEVTKGRAELFAANLDAGFSKGRVYEIGGERVGVTGVSSASFGEAAKAGASDPRKALADAEKWLESQGARIRVALVVLPRGEALRVAEAVTGFQVMLVGKPIDRGEANDPPFPPALVGNTLVVQAPNHLQSVAVVDFFVKDGKYTFADGSGIAAEQRRASLVARRRDLQAVLGRPGISATDRAARSNDLQALDKELATLQTPKALPDTSAFRYELVEVREKLGTEAQAQAKLGDYYKAVNEHNRDAFKDVLPAPVPAGQSGYAGVEACTSCHESERAFWERTPHHAAYASLSRQNKEFNLECVGCHVTGYEAPGGSTVVHVENLKNVQCEVCHGPGSRHIGNPADASLISVPDKGFCGPKCHHVPHVHPDWSADLVWGVIVGEGHQRKKRDAGKQTGGG